MELHKKPLQKRFEKPNKYKNYINMLNMDQEPGLEN